MTKLILHNNVTPEKLIKAGFKKYSYDMYRFCEKLYDNLIYMTIRIDLETDDEDDKLKWDIIDSNTGSTYNIFFFNPNNCTNLVREEVVKNFEELIQEFEKREILYRRDDR